MNAIDKLKEAKGILFNAGIENPERDVEVLLSHCLGIERVILYRDDPDIPDEMNAQIDALLKRRTGREPLQYILGYTEFYGLKIKVGPGVLIPRPETELLAEEAITAIANCKLQVVSEDKESSSILHPPSFFILDLCTGSGCIALALAKAFPDAQVYGTDMSADALGYAGENAELNNIKNITFLKGDLFKPVKGMQFDMIISNPPYIRKYDMKLLQPEIRDWEPVAALDGGEDGLDYYRKIISGAGDYLKENGILLIEIGIGQSGPIRKMAEDEGFADIHIFKDYAGIERIVKAQKE
ncbi:MAG: peptide chain release factor N(5)-glutamine methyltransferase [Thermodesulfovibrionales bacterium]|jgi:release factor glutamine methyltransferase